MSTSVGGREHVDGEKAERRGAIDEDVIVAIADGSEGVTHCEFAIGAIDQLDFGAGEIGCCGGDIQVRELDCAENDFVEGALADECVVDRGE